MYETIVVPLDGSEFAETVLPLVESLALAARSRVVLVTVGEPYADELPYGPWGIGFDAINADPRIGLPPAPAFERHTGYLNQILERFQAHSRGYLDGVASRFQACGVATQVDVLLGRPSDGIARCARDMGAALIAMATHGRTGVARLRYGSVATELAHRSPVPLLIMRPRDGVSGPKSGPRPHPCSVVVPLDGSALAAQALPHATAIASLLTIDLDLIRVVTQPGLPFAGSGDEPAARELESDRAQAAGAYLHGVESELATAGLHAQTSVLFGQPATRILEYAMALQGSMICMTSHGRTGLGRLLLGSVADRVLQEMPDSVYLIRSRI